MGELSRAVESVEKELESKVGNSVEPKDTNNDNILRVYGHDAPHEPACIVGNRKALEALRESIDCALDSGKDSFYVWDDYGDAYMVTVEVDE